MLNIKVKFFEGSIIEALEGGIYQINMQVKNDQSEEKRKGAVYWTVVLPFDTRSNAFVQIMQETGVFWFYG